MSSITVTTSAQPTVAIAHANVTVGGQVQVKNSDSSFDNTYTPDDSPVTLPDSVITVNSAAHSNLPATGPFDLVVKNESGTPTGIILPSGAIEVPDPAPTIADPSSFANALVLLRSDAGLTLVDGLLDIWADQSGNGYHASASSSSSLNRMRVGLTPGRFGFRDIMANNTTGFRNLTLPAITYTKFTLDFIEQYTADWNNKAYSFTLFDGNDSDAFWVQIGMTFTIVLFKVAGVQHYQRYNRVAAQYYSMRKFAITYDGTLAAADRLKLYDDNVLLVPNSTQGTIPSSFTPTRPGYHISSWSSAVDFAVSKGLFVFWTSIATGTELTDNNTWKTEIWD